MRLWQRRNNDLTVLMMLAVFSYTGSVIAAPIGEAELIASALKMPIIQAAEAEVEEVRAAGIKDGLLANPQLSFRRATGSQGASSLNSWSLAVPIDTAGRGATHRYVSASLRARAQASEASSERMAREQTAPFVGTAAPVVHTCARSNCAHS
jgi:hypothetical protein